jgi:hypothetical protein
MGFLGKLRSMTQAIMGGGAKVSLEVSRPSLRQPFIAKITAEVGDNDLKINKVYLIIRAEEEVIVHNVSIAVKEGNNFSERNEDVKAKLETVRSEIEVSAGETLQAHQTYTWKHEVILPHNALPTFHGINANHTYFMQAGLECFGNDPDTGWVEVNIY